MRYIYACFKGYIGFYSGLGLEKLEIDFTKCKNNIILISGKNGCGKSTLLNSLNPFPDPSSSFVPNMDGEKLLTLFNEGDTYNIHIVSPSDTKGGRKQAKAYIQKNGLELNSNGNITTYKEIIFSEFDLDSNYISLTKLSSNDRGLGDKTPADRKRFVANIIDNLETYNELYKTLNKKSLIFKSHINTLHTKIQNIGTRDNLEVLLNSLKQKNDAISKQIMACNNKIVELETRASINQEEAQKIQELEKTMVKLQSILDKLNNDIKLLVKNTRISPEDLLEKYNVNLSTLEEYKSKLEEYRIQWISESERLSSLTSSVNELKANIEMYSTDIDYTMEKRYNDSKSKIDNLVKRISRLGISPDVGLIYKLNSLLDFYIKFIKRIDVFYDGLTQENIKYIVLEYDPNRISTIKQYIETASSKITESQNVILELRQKIKTIMVLDNRPKKCSIDSCPFISEAIKVRDGLKANEDLEQELFELQNHQIELSNQITEYQNQIDNFTFCAQKRAELDNIINDINEIIDILVLFGDDVLSNPNKFNLALMNTSYFNDQREPKRLIDALNLLKELESEQKIFSVLEVEYNSLRNKIDLMNRTSESLTKLEKDIEVASNNVLDYKKKKDSYQSLCDSLKRNIDIETQYINILNEKDGKMSELDLVQKEIDLIQSKSSDSVKSIMLISELKSEIDRLSCESAPIVTDIQKISGQLTLLASYYEEFELYTNKFNMIETLKKYCSPTSGGIQTIFMQLYMSKTLDLANQILGMLFGGEYKLLDFVINQNEFRIPFIGSGLAVDDISSGSTSQICIMGMAINLALFHQASTKFNIARLDEVDSGLDSRNRFEFVNALSHTRMILNIEQLFTISHSIEADTSTVDIIKLKSYSDFEENVQLGNVIYDYNEELKKLNYGG